MPVKRIHRYQAMSPQRMKWIMREVCITQSRLARLFGVSQPSISMKLSGENLISRPEQALLELMCSGDITVVDIENAILTGDPEKDEEMFSGNHRKTNGAPGVECYTALRRPDGHYQRNAAEDSGRLRFIPFADIRKNAQS